MCSCPYLKHMSVRGIVILCDFSETCCLNEVSTNFKKWSWFIKWVIFKAQPFILAGFFFFFSHLSTLSSLVIILNTNESYSWKLFGLDS